MLSCSVLAEGESCGQGSALAFNCRVVEFAQLAEEYVGRPAIEDDVMCGENEDMIFSAKKNQACVEERPFDEMKGSGCFGVKDIQSMVFFFRRRESTEIVDRQMDVSRGRDMYSLAIGVDGGTQSF